jgi:hypothetical protein
MTVVLLARHIHVAADVGKKRIFVLIVTKDRDAVTGNV